MKDKSSQSGNNMIIVILVIALIAVLGIGVFFLLKNRDNANPDQEQTKEQESLGGTLTIEPDTGSEVSGTITVYFKNPPEGTKMVGFVILKDTESIHDAGMSLFRDTNEADGWSWIVDTTIYENGLYELNALPSASADSNPLSLITKQLIIKN